MEHQKIVAPGPLFEERPPFAVESPLSHARLDRLGEQVRAFKTTRRYAMRKALLLSMLDEAAAMEPLERIGMPREATLADRLGIYRTAQMQAQQANDPEKAEELLQRCDDALCGVVARLHEARDPVLPRRKGYMPEKRMDKIHESGDHLALMQRLVHAFDDDRSRDPQMFEQLPHLAEVMESARTHLARLALTDMIAETLRRYVPPDLSLQDRAARWNGYRTSIHASLQTAVNAYRPHVKESVAYDPHYLEMIEHAARPDSPEMLHEAYRYLRYAPCDFATRCTDKMVSAYRKDMRAAGKGGEEALASRFSDSVLMRAFAECRWGLAASHLEEMLHGNFITMKDPGIGEAQGRADLAQAAQATGRA